MFAIVAFSFPLFAADDWPDFRGPGQNGHAGDAELPSSWSESENVKWKTEMPLLGLSSPIVSDNQIWLTTATVEGNDLYALCVDATTGEIIANEKLFHSDDPQSMGNGAKDNMIALPGQLFCTPQGNDMTPSSALIDQSN